MTDTRQLSATPAGASADYQRTIRVKASPGALFDALTSLTGLAAWWTRTTGSGDTGGELRFLCLRRNRLRHAFRKQRG
jgi:hypothetical protein